MKRNRLPIYLFLFLIAVIAFTLYGRSEIKDFPMEKAKSYQYSMRAGIMDILNKIPIDQIEKEKAISRDQSAVLLEKSDRILSSYSELSAIASTYLNVDGSVLTTQSSLENIYHSFLRLNEMEENKSRLTDEQAKYIADVYRFLGDVHNIDVLNMELDDSLEEMDRVARKYPNLGQRMEGFD